MTIPQIIIRAKISQFLAVIAIEKGGLFGNGIPTFLPSLLYQVRKSVERMYALSPTEENLLGNANYLYALCQKFGLQASYITHAGGIISPSVTPSAASRYSYPLTSQYVAIADGETSLELRDSNDILLPPGAIVTWVSKSTTPLPLQSVQYNYVAPNLILLGGISMGLDEILSFQYVVPI